MPNTSPRNWTWWWQYALNGNAVQMQWTNVQCNTDNSTLTFHYRLLCHRLLLFTNTTSTTCHHAYRQKQQPSTFKTAWIPPNPFFTGIRIIMSLQFVTQFSSFSLKFSTFQTREGFLYLLKDFFSIPYSLFRHITSSALLSAYSRCVCWDGECSDCGWIFYWVKGMVSL